MSEKKNEKKLNAEEFGAALQLGVKKGADAAKKAVVKIKSTVADVAKNIIPEKTEEIKRTVEDAVEEEVALEQSFECETEPANIVEAFFMQFASHFKKDCLAPEQSEKVGKNKAFAAIGISAGAIVVAVAAVLLFLTFGITPHTGITVDEFIEAYNSVPATVSDTDATYTITYYLPDYTDIKIPEGATLKGGKTISLYDGKIEISAILKGNNIVRLEVYGVDFPGFDAEQNTFVGYENGDYSYLYYFVALGKAINAAAPEGTVYDAYAAASYAYIYQNYAMSYSQYGMGNAFYEALEVDGRSIIMGYDLDKDCLFFEAVEEPVLNWSGAKAE